MSKGKKAARPAGERVASFTVTPRLVGPDDAAAHVERARRLIDEARDEMRKASSLTVELVVVPDKGEGGKA